jgi:Cys-rich repeat protein
VCDAIDDRIMKSIAVCFASAILVLAAACSSSKKSPGTTDGSGSGSGSACLNDSTCAPPNPYCEPGGGVCVECLGDPNCTNGRFCSATHQCVECVMDSQCGGGGGMPYCSPQGRCVECLAPGNCMTGQTCNTNDYRCVPTCTASTMCQAPIAVCDTTKGYCVQCTQMTDCAMTFNRHVCDTTNDTCVQCLMDTDCTTAPRTKCNTMFNACVQCLTNADCMAGQMCSADGACI